MELLVFMRVWLVLPAAPPREGVKGGGGHILHPLGCDKGRDLLNLYVDFPHLEKANK